ncbi:hypothetical protein FT663_00730 [Candidozyma haemuli var. vulneris]|uniref:Endoplasmic reticulum transmembrane protein n=1 Tax=Candidozyma haemuli TaxID=45357 RepID=A0A2V1ANH0_9ASCO|nr:hypothetical protein CXQ85_003675 [[Candida] haemuloni]KAF3992450.1 hypothetical protein FT662_01159 [[Candida] haemuloni var. vulneris]KAF3995187.1 hypothetical protein FT663_00730 [[Candida] haemuloni var. vulneris]PVH19817.1 hypothetical protein CXQ85_003675 [[Candida] haemuloni]
MALYYNMVFGLLVVEMLFFTILSLPFPRRVRRTVLATVSKPFTSEHVQIITKCIFGFVAVLFIDSVNRVYTVTYELSNAGGEHGMVDRSEIRARKFYAQRNMYLCGFALFLTLLTTRAYSLVAELVFTKDKVDDYKKEHGEITPATGDSDEIVQLKKELASKDEELTNLKEQAEGLSKDYTNASDLADTNAADLAKETTGISGSAIETAADNGTRASVSGFKKE